MPDMMTSQGILDKYQQMYSEARTANEQRYQQGLGILNKAIRRYQPGGGFGQGAMAQYEQGKTQALAGGMQNLVNAGLSNTTIGATLPLAYEQEVGTPFRLQLEDVRMQNLTDAEQAKTGFIEARKDPYPDFGLFANLAMQAGAQPTNTTQYGDMALQGKDVFGQPLSGPGSFGYEGGSGGSGSALDIFGQSSGGGGGASGGGGTLSQGSLAVKTGGTPTSQQAGGTTPSMSEADYQAILNKNMPTDTTTPSRESFGLPQAGYEPNKQYTVQFRNLETGEINPKTMTLSGADLNWRMKATSQPEAYVINGTPVGGDISPKTKTNVVSGYGGNIYGL